MALISGNVNWRRINATIGLYVISCCWLLILTNGQVSGARILGIFPVASRSHYSITRRIMTTLASKGHNVTVISGFDEKSVTPNYRNVYITDGIFPAVDNFNVTSSIFTSILTLVQEVREYEGKSCTAVLSHDHIKEVVASSTVGIKTYDLIIMEIYYVPCYLALAAYLNIPVIWFVAPSSHYPIDYYTGNPNNPACMPGIMSGLSRNMNFVGRLMNVYEMFILHLYQSTIFDVKAVDMVNKQFATNITVAQMHRLPNLAFFYGHYTLMPRPNLPNVVEIGGLHIQEKCKPLPKEIRDFIENAEHGVIFMSFGSTLKASSIPKNKLAVFTEVFSKIPQRVIWRWDIANVTEVSDNVMTGYWFPQKDILEHENVRAFISHGGISGTYEAVYTATPVIGMPFFYDEETDISILEEYEAAVKLDFWSLNADNLLDSINKVINDSRYSENMRKLSSIFKDRPMSALDTAIYWIEYVIRHNGAPHLRSPSAEMPFYKYLLLDVISFVIVCTFLIIFLSVFVIRKVICIARCYISSPPLKNKIS